jgi:transcriptional regulator with XRE-family HTH domain
MRTNVPSAMRALRRMRRWRQADLGRRANLSRDPVSRFERGQLDGMTIGSLDALAGALGATLVVDLRWRGAELDRLVDRLHAEVQEAAARRLTRAGWLVRAEVTFNHYGDRGACDLVALHPATGCVLVVEVKSRLGNVQETLHRLDTKARLGGLLAQQLGWPRPGSVARALVLAELRSTRRVLARHPELFAGFPVRGRRATRWLRRPMVGRVGVLWFEVASDAGDSRVTADRRVRSGPAAG